jgi:hypothetical protein
MKSMSQVEMVGVLFGAIATACEEAVEPVDGTLTVEDEQERRKMWLEVADRLVVTAIKFSDAIAAKMLESTRVDRDT